MFDILADMNAQTKVGILLQVLFVFVLSALWYLVLGLTLQGGGFGVTNAFGMFGPLVYVGMPPLLLALAVLLVISHLRSGRAHRALVYPAVTVAISPCLWFMLAWLS